MVAARSVWNQTHAYPAMAAALCLLIVVTSGCTPSTTQDTGTAKPADQSGSNNTTAVTPAEPGMPAAPGTSAMPAVPATPAVPAMPIIPAESSSTTEDDATEPEPSDLQPLDNEPDTNGQGTEGDATAKPVESTDPQAAVRAANPVPNADDSARAAIAAMGWEPWQPIVEMSQTHASTCLVAVGDTLPSVELPDLDGTTHKLTDLLGSRLTVAVFWDTKRAYAREQYEQLVREVVEPFGGLGVNVVAINAGDEAAAVRELASASDSSLTNLLDAERSVYQVVATQKLPRTYLLDASGKVLWMDIEYSRGTRRELENAIRYYLKLDS